MRFSSPKKYFFKVLLAIAVFVVGSAVFIIFEFGKYFDEKTQFLRNQSEQVSETTTNPQTNEEKQACLEVINITETVEDATRIGDEYLGGTREYDLSCARQAYNHAILIDKKGDKLTWYQLGRVDFLEGSFGSALNKFRNQIEYYGDSVPNVYYMIGLTNGYSARKSGSEEGWKRAEEAFTRFLEFYPNDPWGRTDLAWILFSQGKYTDMEPILAEGLKTHPANPWLLNMYGLAFLNTGERDTAYEYFLRAHTEAKKLSSEEWGTSYPGNSPQSWQEGLEQMLATIVKNIETAQRE